MVYLVEYGQSTAIEPDKGENISNLIYLSSFEFDKRLDGNEILSFDVFTSQNVDDLETGRIYFAYADKALTQLLVSFRLKNKNLKLDGGEDCVKTRLYELECVSSSELLERKRISFTYRNISFKTLLERVITTYRVYVPQISNDFSLIDDLDFTFPVFSKVNVNLNEIFQILRDQGFQVFLRSDLKVQAGERTYLNAFNVDLDINAVGGVRGCLHRGNNLTLSEKYKELPITSIVAKGGLSEEGTFASANAITNKESAYDLLENVNVDANFIFEPFNSLVVENFDTSNLLGVGWQKRYAIYNTPFDVDKFMLFETQIEIIENKEAYFLAIGPGNKYFEYEQNAAFYFQGGDLYIIQNGTAVNTNKRLQPYLELDVLSVSEDYHTFEFASIEDLQVGDKVTIVGTGTGLETVDNPIASINGNFITLTNTPLIGDYDATLKLRRSTAYELRMIINNDLETEFYFRDKVGDFELLGTYSITYPIDRFITAFNFREEPVYTVGNGVWEGGGYAIDYFFMDRATLIKAYDSNNKKITLSSQAQSESVEIQAIVNNMEKNGEQVGQVQFIAPSYIKLILNETITLSRIPLDFQESDQVYSGMRVLINNEARYITAVSTETGNGYIDLNEPLSTLPSFLDQVWINTSIPADDTNFFIEYVPTRTIQLRRDAYDYSDGTITPRFDFKQDSVNLTEYTNTGDLAERLRFFLEEQITPSISGQLVLNLNFTACELTTYYSLNELPTVGEYITVTDSLQGINNRTARIQAIGLRSLDSEGLFTLTIELGELNRLNVVSGLIDLKRQLGIVQDAQSDVNYNLPTIKEDFINIEDTSLVLTEIPGGAFRSGAYVVNYSGNTNTPTTVSDDSLVLTEIPGGAFRSGAYVVNYSGSRPYTTYNLVYNGNQLTYNGNNLTYTVID